MGRPEKSHRTTKSEINQNAAKVIYQQFFAGPDDESDSDSDDDNFVVDEQEEVSSDDNEEQEDQGGEFDEGEDGEEGEEEGGEEEEEEEDEEDDDDETSGGGAVCDHIMQSMQNESVVPGQSSGCTAVVALICPDAAGEGRTLYVANAGDSRCGLCRDGETIDLSVDHKPEDAEEFARITKAGGEVSADGRVCGGLNLSRSLGDHSYKRKIHLAASEQMITALPDIRQTKLTDKDEFLVLACDGIWNSYSSAEVVAYVRERIRKDPKPALSDVCRQLFYSCLADDTQGDGTGCDNMTAIIVEFARKLPDPEQQVEDAAAVTALQESITANNNSNNKRPLEEEKDGGTKLDDDDDDDVSEAKRLKTDDEDAAD
jgi:protein phosphatase 1G